LRKAGLKDANQLAESVDALQFTHDGVVDNDVGCNHGLEGLTIFAGDYLTVETADDVFVVCGAHLLSPFGILLKLKMTAV
jgi:hypothetical protein